MAYFLNILSLVLYIGLCVGNFGSGIEFLTRDSSAVGGDCGEVGDGQRVTFGILTIVLMLWQNIFAGLFILLNGGYYQWSLLSAFCLWPISIYTKASLLKQECGESDQEEVEKAGNFSRIVQIAEAWLVAAPQAVLGLYIIGTGVHPGIFLQIALAFNLTTLVIFTFCHSHEMLKETIKSLGNFPESACSTWTYLTPLIFCSTLSRLVLVLSLIFFFEYYSAIWDQYYKAFCHNRVPTFETRDRRHGKMWILSISFALVITLTMTGTNTLKESVASTLMFLAPFYLGRNTFSGKKFARISGHLVAGFGVISASVLLILNRLNCFDRSSDAILALAICTPHWIDANLNLIFCLILGLNVLYGSLTEFYLKMFPGLFSETDQS